MTWILIAATLVLAMFAVLWAAVAAGARAEAGHWTVDPLLVPPGERRSAAPAVPPLQVLDADALCRRLDAVGMLLSAQRVALVAPTRDGRLTIAAVGGAEARGAEELTAPAVGRTLLVASRDRSGEPFQADDLRLLAAAAATLGDFVAAPGADARTGGRFQPRASGSPVTARDA